MRYHLGIGKREARERAIELLDQVRFLSPLINVFEEDPVFEGSTLGALAGGGFEYVVPA